MLISPMGRMTVLVVGACGAVIWPGTLHAAEWRAEGLVNQRFEYDDNIGLTRADEVSDMASTSTAELSLGGQAPGVDVKLDVGLGITRFFEESALDSDEQSVKLGGSLRTRTGLLEMDARFDRDTTRTTDVDDTGQFILDNETRTRIQVSPSWSHRLTGSDTVGVFAEYIDTAYSGRVIDFVQYTGGATFTRFLTAMSSLDVIAFAFRFEPETVVPQTSDTYGIQVGWNYVFSPDLEWRLSGGLRQTTTNTDAPAGSGGDVDESSTGLILDASATYRIDPLSTLTGAFTRSADPTGSGELVERDRLDLSLRHLWSPDLTLTLAFTFLSQDSVGGGSSSRDFIRLRPRLVWRLTEYWRLDSSYRFRWQSFGGSGEGASSNAFMVSFVYHTAQWSL